MAAATLQAQIATGAGPALASIENPNGFVFNRADSRTDTTTPVPIPTSTGTNYSWLKWLCLAVTVTGTTNISNRRIQLSATETSGLAIFFQGNATYAQATSANKPADNGTTAGPAVPASFTRATTGLQVYDSATVASNATGRNGNYCETCAGVDNSYAGGAGTGIALPDVKLVYDEA